MLRANQRRMIKKLGRVFTIAIISVKKFGFKLRLKVLNSSAERQLCDSEFQTKGALTLKALADNESAIRGTESNSLSADRSVLSGW